jgi:hypothetical protein
MPPRGRTTKRSKPPRPGHQELLDYLATHSQQEAQERWNKSARTIGRWVADAEAEIQAQPAAPEPSEPATDVVLPPALVAAFTGATVADETTPAVDVPAAPLQHEPGRATLQQLMSIMGSFAAAQGLIEALDAETRVVWDAGVHLAALNDAKYRDLGTRLQLEAFARGHIPQALVEGLLARLA